MSKRKDYMRLFVSYCKKHKIWFAVCSDGSIDSATDTNSMQKMIDFEPDTNLELGSKKAYEWLVKEHKLLKQGESND